MIKVGSIPVFGLVVLLSGCGTGTYMGKYMCQTPDKPSFTDYTCWWEVKITKIDTSRREVTGTLPHKGSQEFTFRVRDLDKLEQNKQLEIGKLYLFNNGHNSPYLEPFAEGITGRHED